MATINEYRANIQRAIAEIRATREKETGLIMADELALIKSRVINEGETATGGSFGKYSQAKVPYWFFGSNLKNAAFNVKAKQEELRKKVGYFASYEDWRQINNRPVAFKNFSFTNQMWNTIRPQVIASDDVSTTFVFGSDNKDAQDKINFQKGQAGDFLAQSESERALISELNRQRVFKILQKHKVA